MIKKLGLAPAPHPSFPRKSPYAKGRPFRTSLFHYAFTHITPRRIPCACSPTAFLCVAQIAWLIGNGKRRFWVTAYLSANLRHNDKRLLQSGPAVVACRHHVKSRRRVSSWIIMKREELWRFGGMSLASRGFSGRRGRADGTPRCRLKNSTRTFAAVMLTLLHWVKFYSVFEMIFQSNTIKQNNLWGGNDKNIYFTSD